MPRPTISDAARAAGVSKGAVSFAPNNHRGTDPLNPARRTNNGLILQLHNAAVKNPDGSVRYICGQLLFDPKRPTEIMAQMNYPWLEPTTYEDQHGLVSNVTFVEGLVNFRDTWFAYYGQSDSTLGVATYKVGETY